MSKPKRSKEEWYKILQQIKHGHRGGYAGGYDFGYECFELLKSLGALEGVENLLDVGSGNGRMTIPYIETDIIYSGIDPIKGCVKFCKAHFKPWSSQIRFEFKDIRNERYNPRGKIQPEEFLFGVSGYYDLITMWSVLTHVQYFEVARHYLNESRRCLKTGGKLWITLFRGDKHDRSSHITKFTEKQIQELLQDWKVLYADRTNSLNVQTRFLLQKVEPEKAELLDPSLQEAK